MAILVGDGHVVHSLSIRKKRGEDCTGYREAEVRGFHEISSYIAGPESTLFGALLTKEPTKTWSHSIE